MQVVERRREQAAEESRRTGRDVRRIARLTLAGITHARSFPPGGNGLSKPLDSGLRRNDGGGVIPALRHSSESCDPGLQAAGASINDGLPASGQGRQGHGGVHIDRDQAGDAGFVHGDAEQLLGEFHGDLVVRDEDELDFG